MAVSLLDKWLDMMPANKIVNFGGEYGMEVECVYGRFVMARENIAAALAGSILEGLITEGQAVAVARQQFYDNPKKLYRLSDWQTRPCEMQECTGKIR